jgi:hypothetical protein
MIDVPFEVSPSMDAGQIESFLKQYLGAKVGGVSSGGGRERVWHHNHHSRRRVDDADSDTAQRDGR